MSALPQLWPLALVILGYIALQIMLNLGLRLWLLRAKKQAIHALLATFWSGVANALYFLVAAVLLNIWKIAPERLPALSWGLLALIGLPAGVLLWYLSTLGRKLGLEVFGRGDIVAAEDAILRVAPDPRYITWGVLNLAVIQPLGRELFMRGVFFPLLLLHYGLWPALGATLIVELFLRMNIVWLFQTIVYSAGLSLLYYFTGSALSGLVAAALAGLLHGAALAYMSAREAAEERERALTGEMRSERRRSQRREKKQRSRD